MRWCKLSTQTRIYEVRKDQADVPLRLPSERASAEESYLRRAAADGSDFVAERRHRHQQLVVLVEDAAAGGLVQTQQAFTAQHIQGETWRGERKGRCHMTSSKQTGNNRLQLASRVSNELNKVAKRSTYIWDIGSLVLSKFLVVTQEEDGIFQGQSVVEITLSLAFCCALHLQRSTENK